MKKFLLMTATVLSLGVTSLADTASAAPFHNGPMQTQNNNHGQFNYNGRQFDRQRGPAWNAPRGFHQQNWQRGQRLPSDYRRVEVSNWRAYHLQAPPRGYHYVRVGNDVVLVSIVSGLIGAVIANAFYN